MSMKQTKEQFVGITYDELLAENVKLRKTAAMLASARTDQLVENAKLRELVEDMLSCIEIQIEFDRTPKNWMYEQFAGRAQELGVEVDE